MTGQVEIFKLFIFLCYWLLHIAQFLIFVIILPRLIYYLFKIRSGSTKYALEKRTKPIKTLICVGSGGHTTEIIKLISSLDPRKYYCRSYVMAQTDIVSEKKIIQLETTVYKTGEESYRIFKIPRSRNVGQKYLTSVFSTLYSILYVTPNILFSNPELIICNGPGTCVPVCLVAFLMKLMLFRDTKIIFIESICRVKSFSLTGKILMHFADNIIVHWEELKKICPRADYLGQLF